MRAQCVFVMAGQVTILPSTSNLGPLTILTGDGTTKVVQVVCDRYV